MTIKGHLHYYVYYLNNSRKGMLHVVKQSLGQSQDWSSSINLGLTSSIHGVAICRDVQCLLTTPEGTTSGLRSVNVRLYV